MRCQKIRKYMKLTEVAARWKLGSDSTDLHWAVMGGALSPCWWANGRFAEVTVEGGVISPLLAGDGPVIETLNTWSYPVMPTQVGAFELAYPVICDQSGEEARYFALERPLMLSELLREGVVMVSELTRAELTLEIEHGDELHGRERNTLQKMLLALMTEAFGGWEPSQLKSTAVVDLVAATRTRGHPVSHNAALAHVRAAYAKFPPREECGVGS